MKKYLFLIFLGLAFVVMMVVFNHSSAFALTQQSIDKGIWIENGTTYEEVFSIAEYLDDGEEISIAGATPITIGNTTIDSKDMSFTLTNIVGTNLYHNIEQKEGQKFFYYIDKSSNQYLVFLSQDITEYNEAGYALLYTSDKGNNYYVNAKGELYTFDELLGYVRVALEEQDPYYKIDTIYYYPITYNGQLYHSLSQISGSQDSNNDIIFDDGNNVLTIKEAYLAQNPVEKIKSVIYGSDGIIYKVTFEEDFQNVTLVFDVGTEQFSLNFYVLPELTMPILQTPEFSKSWQSEDGTEYEGIELSYEEFVGIEDLPAYINNLFSIDPQEYVEYGGVKINSDQNVIEDARIQCENFSITQAGNYNITVYFEYLYRNPLGEFVKFEDDNYRTVRSEFQFVVVVSRQNETLIAKRTNSQGEEIVNASIDVEKGEQSEEIYFMVVNQDQKIMTSSEVSINGCQYNSETKVFSTKVYNSTEIVPISLENTYFSDDIFDSFTTENVSITVNTVHNKAPILTFDTPNPTVLINRAQLTSDNIKSEFAQLITINDPYGEEISTDSVEYIVVSGDQQIALDDFVATSPTIGDYTVYAKVKNSYNNYSDTATAILSVVVNEPNYNIVFEENDYSAGDRLYNYGVNEIIIIINFSNIEDYDQLSFSVSADETKISAETNHNEETNQLTVTLSLDNGLSGLQQCSLIMEGYIKEELIYQSAPINLNFTINQKPNEAPKIEMIESVINNNYRVIITKNSYSNLISYISSVSDDYDNVDINDVEVSINGVKYQNPQQLYQFVLPGEVIVTYTLKDSYNEIATQTITFVVNETKPTSEDKTFEFSYTEEKILIFEDIVDSDGDEVYIKFYYKNAAGKWSAGNYINDNNGTYLGSIKEIEGSNNYKLELDNSKYVGTIVLKFLPYNLNDITNVEDAYTCTVNIVDDVAPVLTINQYKDKYYLGQVAQQDIVLKDIVVGQDAIDGTISPIITGAVDVNNVGIYPIEYTFTDKAGNSDSVTITISIMTVSKPNVELVRDNYTIKKGEAFNVYDIIYKIVDNDKIYEENFDQLDNINIDYNIPLDINTPGEYKIYISYTGQFGNVSEIKEFVLTVQTPPNYTLIIILSVVGVGVLIGAIFLIRYIIFKRRSRI